MWIANRVLNTIFTLLLYPFQSLNPWIGMLFISILTSIMMLYLYKYTSNQEQIKKNKEKIKGHFLEIRLFKDNPRLIFKAEWDAMRTNFVYLRYILIPLAIMLPLFVLCVIQLWAYYGFNQFEPGDTTLVKVKLSENAARENLNIELNVPEGLTIESPPIHMEKNKEVDWRIRVDQKGIFDLKFTMPDGATFFKTLKAGDKVERISPRRPGPGLLDQFLYPHEKPYPASLNIQWVELIYDDTPAYFYVMGYLWIFPFIILSIIFAFALKGLLRVEI